jgi:hypothetical protein
MTVLTLVAVLVWAVPAERARAADCGAVTERLASISGYAAEIPPAGPDGAWCVLDGARWRAEGPGQPDLAADRLRVRQSATELEIALQGFRAAPRPADRTMDERLRGLLRLRSADLALSAVHDPAAARVTVSTLRLELTGGTTVELSAEILDADLSLAGLAAGAVTKASLAWRNDGRIAAPLMDLAGEGLAGTSGAAAVDASRAALAGIVAALPAAALDEASREALEAAVRSLPQGRGKLGLTLEAEDGIGAARLGIAAMTDDPLSPAALADLLDGAKITATWVPGLAP